MTDLELVRAYVEATDPAKVDLEGLRPLLADDFRVQDTLMGATDGADSFIAQLRSYGSNPGLVRTIDGIIADPEQEAAAAFVRLKLGDTEVTFLQWFKVAAGRIASVIVVYDPRPFLAMRG